VEEVVLNIMKTKIITIACLFLFGAGFSGCREKPVEQEQLVELTNISVSPTSISLMYRGTPESQQITVTAVPENVPDVTFTCSSGNKAVATVSTTGLVTATGVGSTIVTVTANNQIKKYISVTVVQNDDPCVVDPHPDCPGYVDPDPVPGSSITIGSVRYTVDEKRVEKIEDGIWYLYAQIKNAGKPLIIHSVRYTTAYTGYAVEAWVANDSISGKESPQNMVNRYEKAGREVKMAVNGGFFDMANGGTPLYMQVTKGVLTFPPDNYHPVIGFDERNHPYMGLANINCKLKREKDNSERSITSVNGVRVEGGLVLYNSYKGKRTGTNQSGTEALCEPVDGKWEELDNHINVRCKVEKVTTQGNMEIPKGKIVLSGQGSSNTSFLNNLQPDEYVSVTVNYTIQSIPSVTSTTVRNVLCGSNIILRENTVLPLANDPLQYDSHPRTAAGFTNDKKYVYFTVVEGRYAGSAGVTTSELAQVMQYFGATNAINLDGGGSSCMMVGKKAMNLILGGTWQRPVADGLAIIKK
jgi:exopolysaccharide biosynthesis protein